MGLPAGLLPHTVTWIVPTTSTDAYNNTNPTYGSGTSIAAWLQQDQSKEPVIEGRDAQERNWLLMTNEEDVATGDRIVFGALTFEVDGPPAPVYTPAGFHHLEAQLRKVDG